MVRSFNYKKSYLKSNKISNDKNHLLYIVSVWCCQDDERRHIFADKNCILFVARFRLTCANVCFLFPPSFTTKLVHREKSDWIWLNHVWQETSQIHSIAKPLSHRRDSFWIFVISELHIVCLLYRNSIAVCSRWKTVYSSLARSRIFTQTLITSTAIYLSHQWLRYGARSNLRSNIR